MYRRTSCNILVSYEKFSLFPPLKFYFIILTLFIVANFPKGQGKAYIVSAHNQTDSYGSTFLSMLQVRRLIIGPCRGLSLLVVTRSLFSLARSRNWDDICRTESKETLTPSQPFQQCFYTYETTLFFFFKYIIDFLGFYFI